MTDVLLPERMGRDERLERLDAVIDWDRVDVLLADVHSSRDGRPAYPPLLMAKVMLFKLMAYNLRRADVLLLQRQRA